MTPNRELWNRLRDDYEELEEWLESQLCGLDCMEIGAALGMWCDGRHPKAILNALNRWRNEDAVTA